MKISSWAVRRPVPVIVLFLALSVFGVISFIRLPINADPSVQFPVVIVSVSQSGAAPKELEKTVTRKIEDALFGMAGIRHVSSEITDGSSVTTAEFSLETDIDRAVNDVRNLMSQIRSELPGGIDEPQVERVDTEGGAIAYYSVQSANLNEAQLSKFIDDEIKNRLLSAQGVQQVKRLGGAKQEILVALSAQAINSLQITPDQISKQLAQTNANLPAGKTSIYEARRTIRVKSSAASLEALKDTQIWLKEGVSVRLGDIAEISDSHEDISQISRLNGKRVVAFEIYRAKNASDTVTLQNAQAAIAALNAQFPSVKISEIYSSADTTRENYAVTISSLIEGALLTVIVVFLFLRDVRATIVAAIALPLSMLPTFGIMSLLGYTLNSVTLLALMLVIGILVDDAIVEIENINKHVAKGERPYVAAINAADAIGFAVIAITLTIVAIFLPVSFISGIIGRYFSQFGVTVTAAVLSSLLVARLVTPLLAAYILKPEISHKPQKTGKLKGAYLALLEFALRRRKLALLAGFLLLVLSGVLVLFLPTGFIPKSDGGASQLAFTLPPDTEVEQTSERLERVAKILREHPAVLLTFATAGGEDENQGKILVRLAPHEERSITQKEFEDEMREKIAKFSDMKFAFNNEMAQADVSVLLASQDDEALKSAALALKRQMSEVAGVKNPRIEEPLLKPQIEIKLLPKEAARLGVTAQSLSNTLTVATIGDIDANLAKFNLPDRQIAIRVRLSDKDKNDIEILRKLPVATQSGAVVPLSSVAEISYSQSEASLQRFDKKRKIAVEADLEPGYAIGSVLDSVNSLPIMRELPAGVSVPEYGDSEFMSEMFTQFSIALGAGILMFLLVLVLLFGDFLQPITIFIALPLSLGGAVAGLLLYGGALDLSSVIGILMLMAIVGKNSILLVDFIIEKRGAGMARHDALINSGSERIRPIVMTTIAMVAGMAPALFASGAGASFRASMAVAVICGLIASTLLSLIFVPVVYSLIDDFKAFIAPKLAKFTDVTDEDKRLGEGI